MNQQQLAQFAEQGFNRVPVIREVLADTETPLSTYLKLGQGKHSFFFESVQGGEKWGRYSIIGLPCKTVVRVQGKHIDVETEGVCTESHELSDPFEFVAEYQSRFRVADVASGHRFTGGLVGYFSYDSVRYVEPSIGECTAEDRIGTPDILLMLAEEVVVFDNLRGTISLILNVDPRLEDAAAIAQSRLDELQHKLSGPVDLPSQASTDSSEMAQEEDFLSHFGEQEFKAAVARIKDYIVAGDTMQVVLSQRMSIDFAGNPLNVYRALRYLNPSPYMVYFEMADHTIVSASPEILARVEDGKITVRPLAGTRKRGSTEAEDIALEQELLADAKEIAEHLMLIDLSRNDSGRVSRTGTVTVPRQMFVERYSHVMHIASIVESEIRDDKTALDVLRSTLPVGTLSGAPKVRAMQIIDELEPVKRGVYGGAMGYLSWHGNMDMAIAIRTAVVKDGELYVQAGAGIVADSDPQAEWEETLNKARAIKKAVQLAQLDLKL